MTLNVNNSLYNCYFESTKKAIKYYETCLLEKKKSQPIQFLQHSFTLFPISFFSLISFFLGHDGMMALTRNKIDSLTREEMIEELLKGTLMQI